METVETDHVSEVSEGGPRADAIVEAAGRLFLAPGSARVSMDDLARALGMSKKTIYRHFPDRQRLLIVVLERQFASVENTLVAAAEEAAGQPFGVRVGRFLTAAGRELGRIGAAQLAAGRGDAVVRRYVEQRADEVLYGRLEDLFRDGHRQGLLPAPPELLGEIVRGAVERLLTSQLPHELGCSAADLLRVTVETVLHGAIRPALTGDDENLGAVARTARDDGREITP